MNEWKGLTMAVLCSSLLPDYVCLSAVLYVELYAGALGTTTPETLSRRDTRMPYSISHGCGISLPMRIDQI